MADNCNNCDKEWVCRFWGKVKDRAIDLICEICTQDDELDEDQVGTDVLYIAGDHTACDQFAEQTEDD
jgi:hypothetical protein